MHSKGKSLGKHAPKQCRKVWILWAVMVWIHLGYIRALDQLVFKVCREEKVEGADSHPDSRSHAEEDECKGARFGGRVDEDDACQIN